MIRAKAGDVYSKLKSMNKLSINEIETHFKTRFAYEDIKNIVLSHFYMNRDTDKHPVPNQKDTESIKK